MISIPVRRAARTQATTAGVGRTLRPVLFLIFLAGLCSPAFSQTSVAKQLVEQTIQNELAANRNDHTRWMYRDADKTPMKNTVKVVVQTDSGTVSKILEMNGHPPTSQQQTADRAKIESMVNDPAARARQRRNSAHDDQQATALMQMLPDGFLWTLAGEANGEATLDFKPNPAFVPPTYASRVFAAMAGTMVVDLKQKRLKVLSGKLIRPVEFGWGLLGKMRPGGTFQIVRSEVAPGEWQITQTHVHIQGHALFFKSISEQEDELTGNYKRTPAGLTLAEAAKMLEDGTAAKDIGIALRN